MESSSNEIPGFRDDHAGSEAAAAPSISVPTGGGAIRGIGEKFAANPVTGTGSMTVPIATSPGRSGFAPQLSLAYDSGTGSGPFGFGWNPSLPVITRKTDKGLPNYQDADESDVFVLSGTEDLVPVVVEENGQWRRKAFVRTVDGESYYVTYYRPRVEGVFARIEQWTSQSGDIHWRSISRDNVTTLYGLTAESRIADPADPARVFSWLICQSRDDKGNAIVYEYKRENATGVDLSRAHEKNRTPTTRSANQYLKRIKYGNRISSLVQTDLSHADWMFEVVLDYGEHHAESPTPNETGEWLCRHDPFSSYRAGFEIRTYRLCQRVLMFHHFSGEPDVGRDCLARSTDFEYRNIRNNANDLKQGHPIASFIAAVTQCGYRRQTSGGYWKKSLPPVEFGYSQVEIHEEVQDVDSGSLENLPLGVDGASYQWVDLDGEGISGILTEQADSWFFKRNFSPANRVRQDGAKRTMPRFGPMELVAKKPNTSVVSGNVQFMDLAGDGRLDVVQLETPTSGFYERIEGIGWSEFRPFDSWPNVNIRDPNLRFIDLNGDGHADILISENEVFTWHQSQAELGFGAAARVAKLDDEDKGPRLVFGDATQSIYLADMSGDGMTDLVRIRNGDICYWPNLGYGRFGARVTMDRAPRFDSDSSFDQRRIRLGDIDGSGTTDLFYGGYDEVTLWHNESGNSWSEPWHLNVPSPADRPATVSVVDLLGNGTACLVWSSPLPHDAVRPMRFIDLMGGQKPHLLISVKNNLGGETHVRYAPSTRFYIEDKEAGTPWITRLPFPVHVVEAVETYDRISRNRFVTRYAYHHGYFDGVEREFRGFGMVEQWDTEEYESLSDGGDFPTGENFNAASHVPPSLTKTWFHTGAFVQGGRSSKQFQEEYYQEGDASLGESGLTDEQLGSMLLPDTIMPVELSAEEAREACRALRGSILRQETYGLDGSEKADRPYAVSERNYAVRRLQPHGDNRHAVFFVHPRETVNFHYERNLYDVNGQMRADPRVSHGMTLAVDDFGNVLQSVAIGYGRRYDDADSILADADRVKQKATHATLTENGFTNAVDEEDGYRTALPCESKTFELINALPAANQPNVTNLFRFNEMQALAAAAGDEQHDLPYEDIAASGAVDGVPYRRLLEHMRTLYRANDLSGSLALGRLEALGLPYESYRLAFTPGLLQSVYRRDQQKLLPSPASVMGGTGPDRGGYVDLNGDGNWWIPSGRVGLSADSQHTPAEELAFAREHFFLPHLSFDPFGQITKLKYDSYDLMPVQTTDAVQNITHAENDYRVLQPRLVTDPNNKQVAAKFDALGMLVATAMIEGGGSVAGVQADLEQTEIDSFFLSPEDAAVHHLGIATTRFVYDVESYYRTGDTEQPPWTATLMRERHVNDASGDGRIRISFSYSDGFGREMQSKIQAEPGPVEEGGHIVDPRWVGSGWTIYNNKGDPVRQFEPFFSQLGERRHRFEFDMQVGGSPILFYDPIGRAVATVHPNHSWEKVVFDPWRQTSWDVNDTLKLDPRSDADVNGFFVDKHDTPRLAEGEFLPTWYTRRTDPSESLIAWPGSDPLSVRRRADEEKAAEKTAVHANTPAVAYFDSLGRPFLTLAHNKFESEKPDGTVNTIVAKHATRVILDIEGNQREVIDAHDRTIMRYDYDMLSNRIHQSSMEAGQRWTLSDVLGQPIRAWDSRGHRFRTEYDPLRRPVRQWMRGIDATYSDARTLSGDLMVEKIEYGEGQPGDAVRNLRTRVYQSYDNAGLVTNARYDFKGNLRQAERRLAADFTGIPDWSQPPEPQLETEVFSSRSEFDALSRPTQIVAPHSDRADAKINVIQPTYNAANLLERIDVWLERANVPDTLLDSDVTAPSPVGVANINYNEKGQRVRIEYKNGATTRYRYDPETFRLTHLYTRRAPSFTEDCGGQPPLFPSPESPPPDRPCGLQNLRYTYDPVGNITSIRDDAQQTIYFNGQVAEPHNAYTYDAIYRLITATGREHIGQVGQPTPWSPHDRHRMNLPHPHDGQAMRGYTETYEYDEVGNFINMIHRATGGNWTRAYTYNEPSQITPANVSNRLTSTTILGFTETYSTGGDGYDPHGNMFRMPHLSKMKWDYQDQLQATAKQVVNNGDTPETTYYVYDASGERVRKVTEHGASLGQTAKRKSERIYLDGFEVYRAYDSNDGSVMLERETLHVMDDAQRVALVETRTVGDDSTPRQLIRYQLGNHLGSVSLELDDEGQVITYEEYSPYGSTSYQEVLADMEVPSKRYRYTDKERDGESGLYYYGARYYAPWMGRWVTPDSLVFETDSGWTISETSDYGSLYAYVDNNPVLYVDPDGMAAIVALAIIGVAVVLTWESDEQADITAGLGPVGAGVETAFAIDEALSEAEAFTMEYEQNEERIRELEQGEGGDVSVDEIEALESRQRDIGVQAAERGLEEVAEYILRRVTRTRKSKARRPLDADGSPGKPLGPDRDGPKPTAGSNKTSQRRAVQNKAGQDKTGESKVPEASERRERLRAQGVPDSEIGPAGHQKRHTKRYSRKKDAREAGKGGPRSKAEKKRKEPRRKKGKFDKHINSPTPPGKKAGGHTHTGGDDTSRSVRKPKAYHVWGKGGPPSMTKKKKGTM